MCRGLQVLFFLFLGAIANSLSGHAQEAKSDIGSDRQIDKILSGIQLGLQKVQSEAASGILPKLASVLLELKTEVGYSAGGELSLFVISLGGNTESEQVQRVLLTLVPPPPYSEQPISRGDISESLSGAILAAAKGIASAQRRQPPLVISRLEAEIGFVIRSSGEGGLKTEIVPVSASIKGKVRKNALQTLKVIFEVGK